MSEKKSNSISFWERALTAAIITLLIVGYQRLFPATQTFPYLMFGVELEQLSEFENWRS